MARTPTGTPATLRLLAAINEFDGDACGVSVVEMATDMLLAEMLDNVSTAERATIVSALHSSQL